MKYLTSHKIFLSVAAAIATIFALFLFSMTPISTAKADDPSYIRVIHASPDIGTATVFVDGNMLLNNFQFGTVTPYATIPAGPHKVQVGLIGTGPGAATITQTIKVQPGIPYTVAAIGTTSAGFSLQVFVDDNSVTNGSAKVRIYHLSPGTGSVDVTNSNTTLINNLSYPQASDYLTEPAGSFSADINATTGNAKLPVSAQLASNTITSVFAIGLINGTPKIQFVSAQVNGLPGVPGTGSDPNYRAQPDFAQPVVSVLPELLLLLFISSLIIYSVKRLRRA